MYYFLKNKVKRVIFHLYQTEIPSKQPFIAGFIISLPNTLQSDNQQFKYVLRRFFEVSPTTRKIFAMNN